MDRKSELAGNLERVEEEIAAALKLAGRSRSEVTLIVVTKNFPASDIELLYQLGVRDFGENRDQEAREKIPQVNRAIGNEVRWHFQGQLQRNKLASIGSWADMVHSIDDVKHLKGLSDAALKTERKIQALIQISLDELPNPERAGTDRAGAAEILSTYESQKSALAGLSIVGVMAVAPLNSPAKSAFIRLNKVFTELRGDFPDLRVISAGMSGDFTQALFAGATHLRIGSSILGSREAGR